MSKQDDFKIHLGPRAFDPKTTRRGAAAAAARAPTGPGYHVVQFARSLTAGDRARLQDKYGLTLAEYVPNHAYVEKLSAAQLRKLEREEAFRASVPYAAEFKSAAKVGVAEVRTAARREMAGVPVDIALFPDAKPGAIRQWLNRAKWAQNVVVFDDRESGGQLRLRCVVSDGSDIGAIAQRDEVRWIEEVAEIVEDNVNAATTIQSGAAGAGSIWNHGLHGEGQIIGVIDSAPLDVNHCFFRDATNNNPGAAHRKVVAIRNASGRAAGRHATFVAGCAAGDDVNNQGGSAGRGGAFAARLASGNTGDLAAANSLLAELNAAAGSGARIHTNSWHNNTQGAGNPATYNQNAADVDNFCWLNEDNLVLGSAGNNGEEQGPPGTAKNAICVGAAQADPSEMNFGDGNPGPTADGRSKPELMTVGCAIQSATVNTNCGVATWPAAGTVCATSFATPHAAAAAALARQYYAEGYYPTGSARAADAFTPSGALLKATLVNATIDMTGIAGYPSANEGWGLVRLENTLHFPGSRRTLCVFDTRNADGLSTGESRDHRVEVVNGTERLKITLVWTEPPGTAGAITPIVNDLDLEVISPSGARRFWGNRFVNGVSATGGAPDTTNNVEMVLVNDPAPGYWTVRVRGRAVNVGNPGQGYAVVATGELAAHEEEDKMGMAKLNIFVSALDDPCKLSSRTWYITIYTCDGKVLEWCGERYAVMRAPCGHLEVKVPPGCYYIKGVWSYWRVQQGYRANHFTDAAIVQACCESTQCVTLFNPKVHRCGLIVLKALQDLTAQKVLKPAHLEQLGGALNKALAAVRQAPKKKFELGHERDFQRLARDDQEG